MSHSPTSEQRNNSGFLIRDVHFDTFGRRTRFELDLLNLFEAEGLKKVGSWDDESGIVLSGVEDTDSGGWEGALTNRTLVVTTILNQPYMMIKESATVLQDNNQFEGFVPDMVEILGKMLNFNFTLKIGDSKHEIR